MFEVQQGYPFSSDSCVAGEKNSGSGTPLIYYSEDCIISVCFGQLRDEV